MKKIVLAGLIAVSVVALSQQQASAWVNSRFSVGLNWSLQSGGNNVLWGAWHNGQVPGPESFGTAPQYGAPPQYFTPPMPQAAPSSTFEPPPIVNQASGAYNSPYQFANYSRPVYYYYYPTPITSYYYYGR